MIILCVLGYLLIVTLSAIIMLAVDKNMASIDAIMLSLVWPASVVIGISIFLFMKYKCMVELLGAKLRKEFSDD